MDRTVRGVPAVRPQARRPGKRAEVPLRGDVPHLGTRRTGHLSALPGLPRSIAGGGGRYPAPNHPLQMIGAALPTPRRMLVAGAAAAGELCRSATETGHVKMQYTYGIFDNEADHLIELV